MRVKVVQEPGPAFGKLTVYGEEIRDKVKGSQPQEECVKDITWEAETRCHGSPGRKDHSCTSAVIGIGPRVTLERRGNEASDPESQG